MQDLSEALSAALLRHGLTDAASLARAEQAAIKTGDRLDVALTRLGLVSDADMARILAEVLRLPLYDGRMPDAPVLPELLDATFLRNAKLLPITCDETSLRLASSNPLDRATLEAIAYLTRRHIDVSVATAAQVERGLDAVAGGRHAADEVVVGETSDADVQRLRDLASEAPIIRLVHDIIERGVEARASDIHIEPDEIDVRIRYRIDGELHPVRTLPRSSQAAIASRIKVMARLDIAERRLPQDGRIRAPARGRDVDLRVSTMPTLHGENLVLRILDRDSVPLDLSVLGLSPPQVEAFSKLLTQPNGVVLVTGPTGSGKTTTLYASLVTLNTGKRKIYSIEDPIEYELPGISQTQVRPQIGLTFASALRSILRQDPDVIMVGEIRDLETAQIAVQSALTGHLVLSTLHTNSAVSTLTRLVDMGLEDFLLASSIRGILAQRLVRQLCPACAIPAEIGPAMRRRLETQRRSALAPSAPILDGQIKAPRGCSACRGTGYAGRTTISELLTVTPAIRDLVVRRVAERDIEAHAMTEGMTTLYQDGLEKAVIGQTSFDEVLRVCRVVEP